MNDRSESGIKFVYDTSTNFLLYFLSLCKQVGNRPSRFCINEEEPESVSCTSRAQMHPYHSIVCSSLHEQLIDVDHCTGFKQKKLASTYIAMIFLIMIKRWKQHISFCIFEPRHLWGV